ncbi:hypothetical protein A6A11_03700 [Bisgaardia hudsonensis]|nr:hypothetical protein A6A11_03700 [Bisgaardia hudsonensis]
MLAHIQQVQAIHGIIETVELGQVFATSTVVSLLGEDQILKLLQRHIHKDWGDLEETDWYQNELSLLMGNRIVSSYHINNEKIFIITEANRSYTTIMMAYEY